MRVLFVSSGNSRYVITPFIKSQGESLERAGIDVQYFPVTGKGLTGYLKNVNTLKNFIRQNNIDIIHAHYSLIGFVAVLTFTRKPLVLSLMGSDTYGDYDARGKRILKSYIPMFITQIIQPFVDGIIVKSTNLYKYVYRKKITQILPNGVNFERFKPMDRNQCRKQLNLPPDKKLVLFLADPDNQRKNFHLLKAAEPLIKTPHTIIINPFPIDHKDFPQYLNACDVFVLTSYNEGSPNVIKEAMACDCPIVSTDVGDVKEIIHGVKGCYLTSFDAQELAGKIDDALSLNSRTDGRKHIEHLSDENIVTKLIHIYNNLG